MAGAYNFSVTQDFPVESGAEIRPPISAPLISRYFTKPLALEI